MKIRTKTEPFKDVKCNHIINAFILCDALYVPYTSKAYLGTPSMTARFCENS